MKKLYFPGTRIGRLTIVSRDKWKAQCHCDCGNGTEVWIGNLSDNHTTSCGCLRIETTIRRSTIHGQARRKAKTRAFGVWCGIKRRCNNKSGQDYPNYGGRGIIVCAKWGDSFEAFFKDMGEPPIGMSIDRKNNDGPYSKKNCRWVTRTEQNNNTRRNHYIKFRGKNQTIAEWSRETGVKPSTILYRIQVGKTTKEVLAK